MINNRNYSPESAIRLTPERVLLYAPQTEWLYSHHPHITCFHDSYHAMWSNGRIGEDSPGQRILIASSQNGAKWSAPRPLLNTQAGKHSELVLTAAGFHQHSGHLIAYIGSYEYQPEALENGKRKPSDTGHTDTTLRAMTTKNGVDWNPPVDLGLPLVPNHGPESTTSGRLIISGNTAFPWTDDPSGLTRWRMAGLYPETMAATIVDDSETFTQIQTIQGWSLPVCEGSFFQTADGQLHMMLRTNADRLWVSKSCDDGETWSSPTPTGFSDNGTKFHFGRLPDGRFYYVGNPDPEPRGHRHRLVLSLSENGIDFDRHYLIADSPYEQKAAGMHKCGNYGYPHSMIHDNHLFVIVSRKKEAIEVIRVDLDALA